MKAQKVRKIRLKWKIALSVAVMVFLVILALLTFSVIRSRNDLMDAAKAHASSLAQATAAFVEPELMTSLSEGDEEKEEYLAEVEDLRHFIQGEDISDIYTMRRNDDGTVVIVLDADEEDPLAGNAGTLEQSILAPAVIALQGAPRQDQSDEQRGTQGRQKALQNFHVSSPWMPQAMVKLVLM